MNLVNLLIGQMVLELKWIESSDELTIQLINHLTVPPVFCKSATDNRPQTTDIFKLCPK